MKIAFPIAQKAPHDDEDQKLEDENKSPTLDGLAAVTMSATAAQPGKDYIMIEPSEKEPCVCAIGIEKIEPRSTDHMRSVVFRVEALRDTLGVGNPSEHLSFVTIDSGGDNSKCDIAPLLSTLGNAGLVFVVAGRLDESYGLLLGRISGAIFDKGIRTFLVLRDTPETNKAGVAGDVPKVSVDGVIALGSSTLETSRTPLSLDNSDRQAQGYLLPPVIRAIADLIIRPSYIGIDLHDVLHVLCGKLIRCGIGSAHIGNRPIIATAQAVACLADQGIDLSEVDGVLCSLSGSSCLCMDDYESVCNYLHTRFGNDNNLVVPIINDLLGENVVVNLVVTLRRGDGIIPGWIDIRDRVNRTPHIPRALMGFCSDNN